MEIKVKKLHPEAILPKRGSSAAAGCDLYACIPDGSITIPPHATVRVGTGLAMAIPEGYFGGIFARSGLATKEGLRPANCVGVVDSDYRGENQVPLHNDTDTEKTVHHGDRIAQMVILPCPMVEYTEAE